jgi:hypothetical protein
MVMWSFPVTSLDTITKRATAAGVTPFAGPISYTSPSLGQHKAMTFIAPNGFMVEVFEP